MSKIGIQELARTLSHKRGLTTEQAELFVNSIFDALNLGLEEDKQVKIKGLGTFKVTSVRNRESINVNTGERVVIEGHEKLTFTPEPILRDMINKPFAQFDTVVLNDGVDFSNLDKDIEPNEDKDVEDTELPVAVKDDIVFGKNLEREVKGAVSVSTEHEIVCEDETEEPVVNDRESQQLSIKHSEHNDVVVEDPTSDAVNATNVDSKDIGEQENVDMVSNKQSGVSIGKISLMCTAFLVLALSAGGLGYYFGTKTGNENAISKQSVLHKPVKPVKKTVAHKHVGTPQKASPAITAATSAKEDAKMMSKAASNKESLKTSKSEKSAKQDLQRQNNDIGNYDIYASKDARVRTGAYRIVGISKIVKLRSGETLKNISDRYLGPEMECYVEAVNGSKYVSPGSTIKIPKLELKKSRRNK